MIKADLHCHTNYSDGFDSVKNVIEKAKRNNVTHLAITDHDTTEGLFDAFYFGQKYGVEIIPGIEVSTFDYLNGNEIHIIGLMIDPDDIDLKELCEPMKEQRQLAGLRMVRKIKKAGYNIDWEDVKDYAYKSESIFKQHIMHALYDVGYCDEIYGDLYKKFFSKEKDSEGTAYVPLSYIDVVDAIKTIKKAKGLAILAHPGIQNTFNFVKTLIHFGLDGIEVYHPDHSKDNVNAALKIANRNNLIITGGSDYHGFYHKRKANPGDYFVGADSIKKIYEKKYKQNYVEIY